MRALLVLAAAAAITGHAGQAVAGEPAPAPISGTYAANVSIDSTYGTGCYDSSATQFAGEVSYNGLAGTTAVIRIPLADSGQADISTQIFKITAGAGTTHPSGTFTWTGKGVGFSWNVSGTFAVTITEVDAHDFVLANVEKYTNCQEDQIISLVRFGPEQ